ncbi:peptidoglycan-binding protein, partial [Streptomyces sp. NPDC031705]|uniref:peptidoglycan-binding domain-containing protein n=1 Tax=Streptomyces sp. NPDC031705 TaxID=3155729 RepID=UPI0033E00EA0
GPALGGGAGTLAFLMCGPAPEPAPASLHPDLAVPALPARSPGAGEPSVRSRAATGTPPASATARTPSATPSSAKPATSPPGAGKPSPKPAAGTSRTLRPGDRGPDVSALQERLYGQGFTYVSVTGVYDGQTKRGVAQLQRDRDIQGDPKGVYGPATQAAFG